MADQGFDWRQRIDNPLTPVEIEARLRASVSMLANAQSMLKDAREAETEAEIDYRQATYKAMLSPECPVPARGGVTVGERDQWVARQAFEQWQAYRRAQTVREAAQDHLRTVRDIVEVLRSLGASVRTAYEGAGYSGGR